MKNTYPMVDLKGCHKDCSGWKKEAESRGQDFCCMWSWRNCLGVIKPEHRDRGPPPKNDEWIWTGDTGPRGPGGPGGPGGPDIYDIPRAGKAGSFRPSLRCDKGGPGGPMSADGKRLTRDEYKQRMGRRRERVGFDSK